MWIAFLNVLDLSKSCIIHATPSWSSVERGHWYWPQGDTLYSISKHYGVSIEAIQAANGIDDPNFIHEGTLYCPQLPWLVCGLSSHTQCIKYPALYISLINGKFLPYCKFETALTTTGVCNVIRRPYMSSRKDCSRGLRLIHLVECKINACSNWQFSISRVRVVSDMSWDTSVFSRTAHTVHKAHLPMYSCIKVMVFPVFLLHGAKIWYRGHVWCSWSILSLSNFLADLVVGKVDCKCSSCISKCSLTK